MRIIRQIAQRLSHALAERGLPEWLAWAAGWGGLIALALATVSPWFLAPAFAPLGEAVRGSEPAITWLFRALCLGVAVGGLVRPRRALPLAAGLLLALLLYPTAILHSSPGTAARIAWLWHQHDELTGYAGDIYTAQEVRDASWQQLVLLVDEPIENRILKAPAWNPANLEWGRTLEITEWFGLSTWFSQGLARGWVLAMAGTTLLLVARLARHSTYQPAFAKSLLIPSAAVLAVFALAALPFLASAHFLTRARDLARAGDAAAALTALERAGRILPAIREDGACVRQVGRLESELRRATPAAEIHRAQRLAEDGFIQQARAALLAALDAVEPGSVGQREVVRSLLSQAITELNSGQANAAMTLLETILAADPTNLKANYALQLACVRTGRLEELRLLVMRMQEAYRFLNTPTKRSVLAASREHLAAAELRSGTPTQALAQWRSAKRPPK